MGFLWFHGEMKGPYELKSFLSLFLNVKHFDLVSVSVIVLKILFPAVCTLHLVAFGITAVVDAQGHLLMLIEGGRAVYQA
ncbi:hypothetical protein Cni_G18932 [Canna indica]|uniref:Uncharacterized protein n=1 Tax=Canna indica TaxID=4628 RepID=A0AAQ3KNI5_9LILI|nr:hypothetical protein Cni_G18932 [Canna indica]